MVSESSPGVGAAAAMTEAVVLAVMDGPKKVRVEKGRCVLKGSSLASCPALTLSIVDQKSGSAHCRQVLENGTFSVPEQVRSVNRVDALSERYVVEKYELQRDGKGTTYEFVVQLREQAAG
jgi:hypothetical protein